MSWEHRAPRQIVTVVPLLIVGKLFDAIGRLVNRSTDRGVIAAAHAPEKGRHRQHEGHRRAPGPSRGPLVQPARSAEDTQPRLQDMRWPGFDRLL